jgi:hypothetical protein
MRPTLRTHRTPAHFLQVVVAYRCCRSQGTIDVIFMDDVSLLRTVSPDAGKAVSLQLQINGKRILFAFILLG